MKAHRYISCSGVQAKTSYALLAGKVKDIMEKMNEGEVRK